MHLKNVTKTVDYYSDPLSSHTRSGHRAAGRVAAAGQVARGRGGQVQAAQREGPGPRGGVTSGWRLRASSRRSPSAFGSTLEAPGPHRRPTKSRGGEGVAGQVDLVHGSRAPETAANVRPTHSLPSRHTAGRARPHLPRAPERPGGSMASQAATIFRNLQGVSEVSGRVRGARSPLEFLRKSQ